MSERWRGAFPQNIWSVHNGFALEAQLGNQDLGDYHGYPLQANDVFSEVVLAAWESDEDL